MKIRIRYEDHVTTIEVPEDDFSVMVELDYEDRRSHTDNPISVQRRTPQEILDDRFNKPDYNNWHTYHRHWDTNATPPCLYDRKQYPPYDPEAKEERQPYSIDDFPDLAAMEEKKTKEQDQEIRAWIRKKLKPDYAEMLIAIHMDGMTITDYAARIGEKQTNVAHRLKRAEKKFKEIFPKRPI